MVKGKRDKKTIFKKKSKKYTFTEQGRSRQADVSR